MSVQHPQAGECGTTLQRFPEKTVAVASAELKCTKVLTSVLSLIHPLSPAVQEL